MKSILVIGMGVFGRFAALKYMEEGNEVMCIDKREDRIQTVAGHVTSVQIGDCTDENVLMSIGVNNFDIVLVAVSENFQASLEITSLVSELGANYVIAKAEKNIQEKFLLKNGADSVVYPNREMANQLAVRTSTGSNIFDSVELSSEYSIYETTVPEQWVGKSIMDLNIRRKYHLNVLGTKKNGIMLPMPDVDYVFSSSEHIILLGTKKDISKIVKK